MSGPGLSEAGMPGAGGPGPSVKIYETAKIVGIENIRFGDNIIIDDFVFIYAKKPMLLGDHVHIACFSSIAGGERVEIGNFSAVSHGCRVLSGSDDFTDWGFGNSTMDETFRNVKRAPISIGNFCVIGANSVILPGVTIGDGASIGAGSIVTKDLDPWGVYLGDKRIRERNREGVMDTYRKFLIRDR